MPDAEPTQGRSSQPLTLLTEGVLLAVGTGAVYALAFVYETGYADCYGYPHWLIDIGLPNVVLAWVSICLALLVAGVAYFFFGALVPARVLSVLLFSRATLLLVAGVMAIAMSPHLLQDHEPLPRWAALVPAVVGSAMLILVAALWLIGFRRSDRALPTIERIAEANKQFAPPEPTKPIRDPNGTVLGRTLAVPGLGTFYVLSTVLLVVSGVLIVFANGFGSFRAGWQREYWVSTDSVPLVALRRYGDNVIAIPMDEETKRGGIRRFQTISAQSAERSWRLQFVDRETASRLACR